MDERKDKATEKMAALGTLFGTIVGWFISAGLILWGWNTLASHFGYPQFTYWEIFAMRVLASCIVCIFRRK